MTYARHAASRSRALPILILCLAWTIPSGLSGERVRRPTPAKPVGMLVPLRAGERLDYHIQWLKLLHAATLRLSVLERRPFYGREAWHLQAVAHTLDPLRILYALDDQFDSYSDPGALAGLQYEMYVREQGKQEQSIFRMSAEGDPAPPVGVAVRVLPETRDPLGFLYYLRGVDWQQKKEIRAPVFDGKKLYEARARLGAARDSVSVPAGQYSAARIEVRIYERGQPLGQTRFSVWLAHDTGRTPVLIEVELPFGTGRVELIRAQ